MKLRKIRNIPIDVCAGEQMVAYNIAFRASVNLGRRYKKLLETSEDEAESLVQWIINYDLASFEERENKNGRFNIEAIRIALNSGLAKYLENDFIASDYAKVGNAFPLKTTLENAL